MAIWQKIALIALAGGVGALARYGVSTGVATLVANRAYVPLGILAANAIGCLLFGCVVALGRNAQLTTEQQLILLTGFLGAFTTFSSYMHECSELIDSQLWGALILYLALQNGVGIVALYLGFSIVRWCSG